MYIICVIAACLALAPSTAVNFYAGITFTSPDLPADLPSGGKFFNRLYVSYHNTVVDNGEKRVDHTFRHLASIASGLSLFTDAVYDLERLPPGAKNKHLLGPLESWCYALTLFIFYPKLADATYKDESLFPLLVDRCMSLNCNLTNYKVDSDFVDVLIKTDTKLDDVYLFEKFARMPPRPCYLPKDKLGPCNKRSNLKDLDLVNDFVANTRCYMSDFLHRKCVPYADLRRSTTDSLSALLDPDANIGAYADKWAYTYMPKRAELELSMENLAHLLFLRVVSACETRSCRELQDLVTSIALKNLSIKRVVLQLDPDAREASRRLALSFALTFQVDPFRATTINRVFDFLIENVDFDKLYGALLGRSASDPGPDAADQAKEPAEPATLRERYERFRERRAQTSRPDPPPGIPEIWGNRVDFLKLGGSGQHRQVTFSLALNQAVFRGFAPVDSKFFLKVSHTLDTSVYVDPDELRGSFNLLGSEKEVLALDASPVAVAGAAAAVELRALLVPFVDVEQPEMNSSPVVFHGYVALDEAVRRFERVVVSYSLTLHTRYMHMHKGLTPELARVDNLRILRNEVSREYALALVAQPQLFLLNPYAEFAAVPLRFPYLRYLRFLKELSFGTFATPDGARARPKKPGHTRWVPVVVDHCNGAGPSAKLCQGLRTGPASVTRVVNTFFCNPIIREVGGDVVEAGCFLAFSVPVGNRGEYPFVRNVTFATLVGACLLALFMVARYFAPVAPRPRARKRARQ